MEKIGFMIGKTFIYWSPLLLTLSAVAAICLFVGLRAAYGKKLAGVFLTVPLALVLSLFLARLIHWYCNPDSYESLGTAIMDLSSGGFALIGAFVGCLVAVCIMRKADVIDDLPGTLDCLALSGALGMAVGRLNHMFNSFDRGMIVESIQSLPLVYPVENAVSGEPEYRLATFMLQAIVAGVAFIALSVFFFTGGRKHKGDTCLLFLLVHGASQILLDSTRYDSLFLRSNGFVSLVQIAGAILVVLTVVLFSVRLVRTRGWKWWYLALWISIVALLTCAGFMEYFVQRRSNQADQFYHIMNACLTLIVGTTVAIRCLGIPKEKSQS